MINKLSSEMLCAHIHDAFSGHGVGQREIDALVSTIYGCDRTIPMCKEIASLCKSIIANSEIDYTAYNHIPFKKRKGQVVTDNSGLPELVGVGWSALNKLIHCPRSDERDKSLIVLTKLHGYVQPLRVDDAVKRTPDMISNIESRHSVDPEYLEQFREYTRHRLERSKFVREFNWREHLQPLHMFATKYLGSTKKKPAMILKEGKPVFSDVTEASELQAYMMPLILTGSDQRDLYLSNKIEYLTLMTGEMVTEVEDDSLCLALPVISDRVGRMGIRMQEAEKVRTLWMPKVPYESLCAPGVELLEGLVRRSKHQSTYLDDSDAASKMRLSYFPREEDAGETIYSIDQSSFTDNFPYELQRIVLEEACKMGKIPMTCVNAFDYMVKGGYHPSIAYTRNCVCDHDVHFLKGTPMGGAGLFMLATLSHEYVVGMLEQQLHVNNPYYVQGDDCTLQGDLLYQQYRSTMSMLGCTVNESKTMQSKRAFEYCGFISTPTQSVPMYRPHDRHHDHPRDVVSERALSAFSESTLREWIESNRPDILIPLQIAGLLAVSEDDDDTVLLLEARQVCAAMCAGTEVLQPGISREQMRMYFEIREAYPQVKVAEERHPMTTTLHTKSDYDDYHHKLESLKRHYKCLLTDPRADLMKESALILDLCDDIQINHKDRLSELHPPTKEKEDSRRESGNPYKPKIGNADTAIKSATRAMDLVLARAASFEERSKSQHDEDDLPGP